LGKARGDVSLNEKPVWAGRIPRWKIAQLYANDAAGLPDEDLIDEIGTSLYARCEAMMAVTETREGKAVCPHCEKVVYHSAKHTTVRCEDCNWELEWTSYIHSARRKQLGVGGIEPFLQEFIRLWPRARTPRNKMLLIDDLIHRYHWELKGESGRPSAVNLIGGKIPDIVAFLDSLTYSEKSTVGLEHNYARWRKQGRKLFRKIERHERRKRARAQERTRGPGAGGKG